MQFPIHPHMLRHGCGYALANAGHDTRGRYRVGSATRTFSTQCVTPSWLLIGLRTSGAENLSSRCRLEPALYGLNRRWGLEVMGPAGGNGLGSTFVVWASAAPCLPRVVARTRALQKATRL